MDGARSPAELTRTTTQLLDALADPADEAVWVHFDARYRPVIAGLARRIGLDDAAADEAAQQTLTEFLRAYRAQRYDRAAGRLSSWMLGIARHTALRALRDRRRDGAAPLPDDLPDEGDLRAMWDEERDRALLHAALAALRDDSSIDDRTLRAFELAGLRGVPAAEVAGACGMSVNQVYVAKSRITARLRALVEELTEAFEDDA